MHLAGAGIALKRAAFEVTYHGDVVVARPRLQVAYNSKPTPVLSVLPKTSAWLCEMNRKRDTI